MAALVMIAVAGLTVAVDSPSWCLIIAPIVLLLGLFECARISRRER